jgi:sec-independent protein translocase protein TatA
MELIYNMGRLGWSEIIVIVIAALLIFGPKKLPELARSVGTAINEFKNTMAGAAGKAGTEAKQINPVDAEEKKNEDKPLG